MDDRDGEITRGLYGLFIYGERRFKDVRWKKSIWGLSAETMAPISTIPFLSKHLDFEFSGTFIVNAKSNSGLIITIRSHGTDRTLLFANYPLEVWFGEFWGIYGSD